MQLLRGWKVRYFLQISVCFLAVWLPSCQQVEAILRCYDCAIWSNVSDPELDPCFNPVKSKAPTMDCPTGPDIPEALGCYKTVKKNYNDSVYLQKRLDRSCRFADKNEKTCRFGENLSYCLCNDRDLCNDEPGLELSEANFDFDGSRPTKVGSKVSIAVSDRFGLPRIVLALLSGCFGIVPKLSHHTIVHGY